ncbi:carbon-nitrogen hydrolase family protein [Nostoc sp. DSM 114159]|jgi:predicted amidohydrolase
MLEPKRLRMAVAQTTLRENPSNSVQLRESGREIRHLMCKAHEADARLVHFPEGATCSPHKRIMSIDGPEKVGPADWDRVQWDVLQQELNQTAALAQELRLWVILGSLHRLTPPHRPHNSLYVISDRGEVVTRYDERMLSKTKLAFMYTPGSLPVTFQIDGLRFGCSVGMECQFAEVFSEYERLNVDCVLFSTAGPGTLNNRGMFAIQAQALAATNSYWVSYAAPAQNEGAPSGLISPRGEWLGQCPQQGEPMVAIVDLDESEPNLARLWRRKVRTGIYQPHLVCNDARSDDRRTF